MSSPTQDPSKGGGPVVSVKPQNNIYTVLLLIGAVCVVGAWVYTMMLLKSWYGITFVGSSGG
jgi:hypothetical protein